MAGPLSGVRILDCTTVVLGPWAAQQLGDLGADVIKIEPPGGGDPLRQWRKLHEGTSLWWYVQNRNKLSVTANLREAEGQEIVRRLARSADVVIENFRPGTLEKWGITRKNLDHVASLVAPLQGAFNQNPIPFSGDTDARAMLMRHTN